MADEAWFDKGQRVRVTSTVNGPRDQRGTRGKLGTVRSELSCMGWVAVEVDGREGAIEYALDQIEPTAQPAEADGIGENRIMRRRTPRNRTN